MNLIKSFFLRMHRSWLWVVTMMGGLFIPRYLAHAFPGLDILTAPFIFLAKVITLLLVAMPVSLGFLYMAQVLLNWAASPALIGGITSNQFVLGGWGIMRDFSNMFFILIMVAIGIATALRVKQYEVKKTLPALVVVAILINFSPVICGLVIDASNIFMNFFLTAGASGFNKTLTIAQSSAGSLSRDIRSAMGHWSEIWRGVLFFKMLFAIIFNLVAGFVLLLFALLFIMRNLALWILVILSPLAFLSAVLPATKKIVFDRWRKEFLNWCFIGVTASFFIYLSQLMINLGVPNLFGHGAPPTENTGFGGRTITTLLMESIPIIFLAIGYSVTISSSAMGASMITSVFKKGTGWTRGKLSKAGKNKLKRLSENLVDPYRRVANKATQGATNRISVRQQKWQNSSKWGKVAKAIPYWATQKIDKNIARVTGKISPESEAKTKRYEEAKKKTETIKTPEGLSAEHARAKGAEDDNAQVATMIKAVENGDINLYSEEDIKETIKKANKINKKLGKKIMESVPHIAQQLYDEEERTLDNLKQEALNAHRANNKTKENKLKKKITEQEKKMENSGLILTQEDQKRYGSLEEKIILTMKSKNIDKLSKDYVTNKNNDPNNKFMEIVQDIKHQGRNAWSGNKLSKMADTFESPAVERYNEITDRQGIDWFNKNNIASKWIKSSPGAYAAGYRSPNTPNGGGGGNGGGGNGGGGNGGGGNGDEGGSGYGSA